MEKRKNTCRGAGKQAIAAGGNRHNAQRRKNVGEGEKNKVLSAVNLVQGTQTHTFFGGGKTFTRENKKTKTHEPYTKYR